MAVFGAEREKSTEKKKIRKTAWFDLPAAHNLRVLEGCSTTNCRVLLCAPSVSFADRTRARDRWEGVPAGGWWSATWGMALMTDQSTQGFG